jgi:hypothetical protein
MDSSREFKGETGEWNPLNEFALFNKRFFRGLKKLGYSVMGRRICVLREGTYLGDF